MLKLLSFFLSYHEPFQIAIILFANTLKQIKSYDKIRINKKYKTSKSHTDSHVAALL